MSIRLVDANSIIDMEECSLELQDKINAMPEVFTDEDLDGAFVEHVKHGHWIFKPFPDDWVGQLYICSECNETSDSQSRYCPHCGAKMNEGSTE